MARKHTRRHKINTATRHKRKHKKSTEKFKPVIKFETKEAKKSEGWLSWLFGNKEKKTDDLQKFTFSKDTCDNSFDKHTMSFTQDDDVLIAGKITTDTEGCDNTDC